MVSPVNSSVGDMARMIDPADLVDSQAIAEILRLGSRNAVSVYRGRHESFPEPLVNLGAGRPMLWLRSDIEAWVKGRQ